MDLVKWLSQSHRKPQLDDQEVYEVVSYSQKEVQIVNYNLAHWDLWE